MEFEDVFDIRPDARELEFEHLQVKGCVDCLSLGDSSDVKSFFMRDFFALFRF